MHSQHSQFLLKCGFHATVYGWVQKDIVIVYTSDMAFSAVIPLTEGWPMKRYNELTWCSSILALLLVDQTEWPNMKARWAWHSGYIYAPLLEQYNFTPRLLPLMEIDLWLPLCLFLPFSGSRQQSVTWQHLKNLSRLLKPSRSSSQEMLLKIPRSRILHIFISNYTIQVSIND